MIFDGLKIYRIFKYGVDMLKTQGLGASEKTQKNYYINASEKKQKKYINVN
jgi:hypothetical protein